MDSRVKYLFFDCPFLSLFVSFLLRFATSLDRAAFSSLSGDTHLLATTHNHRSSIDNVRCDLQPHFQAGSLPLKAYSSNPASETKGPEQLMETSSSETAHSQLVVSFPPRCWHNIIPLITDKILKLFNVSEQRLKRVKDDKDDIATHFILKKGADTTWATIKTKSVATLMWTSEEFLTAK